MSKSLVRTTLARRIQDAHLANDETRTFLADSYLSALYDTMFHLQDQYGRRFVRLLALCAVFILFVGASVSQVSLGGVEMKDLGPIEKFLPIAVAYTFVQLVSHLSGMRIAERTAREVTRIYYPAINYGDLDLIIMARTVPGLESLVKRSTWSRVCAPIVYTLGSTLTVLGTFVAPVLFEGYAFWTCFQLFGVADPLVWASMLISIALLIEGAATATAVHWSPLGISSANI